MEEEKSFKDTDVKENVNGGSTPIVPIDDVTIRFAGDSGDGMQLTGAQFSDTVAASGLDVGTLPDYPAEIRAPLGTLYGVSGLSNSLFDT